MTRERVSGVPTDKHKENMSIVLWTSDKTVGAKNMHSSSGWAVTRSTRAPPDNEDVV